MSDRYVVESVRIRLAEPRPPGSAVMNASEAVRLARALYKDFDADQEHFSLLALDNKNRLLKVKAPLFSGGQDQSFVDPRVVFRTALLAGAAAIILVHNHPSGDPAPSADDVRVTEKLISGGKVTGVLVLDHVVLGSDSHVSFRETYSEMEW